MNPESESWDLPDFFGVIFVKKKSILKLTVHLKGENIRNEKKQVVSPCPKNQSVAGRG